MQEQSLLWTRRSFFRLGAQAALASAAVSGFPLRGAAGGSGRTVVCVYLFGGNDSNNLLIEMGKYDIYASARGKLALPGESLLRVTGAVSQTQYGFHPSMTEVAELFSSRALAVVANVGRLSRVMTNGSAARAEFHSLTYTDSSLLYLANGFAAPGWAHDLARVRVTGFAGPRGVSGLSLVSSSSTAQNAADIARRGASKIAGLRVPFPSTGIGQQLQSVAGAIADSEQDQVFLVQMGGFNTRSNQLKLQANLLRDLSEAMGAFHSATVDLGVANRVVTYTDTEFSRALIPNASGGSERGWGGHQLVMGGAVAGGEVYGILPSLQPGGADDVTGSGVWLPAVSKDQYTAAFSQWMGLPAAAAPAPGMNFLV